MYSLWLLPLLLLMGGSSLIGLGLRPLWEKQSHLYDGAFISLLIGSFLIIASIVVSIDIYQAL